MTPVHMHRRQNLCSLRESILQVIFALVVRARGKALMLCNERKSGMDDLYTLLLPKRRMRKCGNVSLGIARRDAAAVG